MSILSIFPPMIKDHKQLSIVILSSVLIALFINFPILWITILHALDDRFGQRRFIFLIYNILGNFTIAMILFHFNLSWRYLKISWLNKMLSYWAVMMLINIAIAIILGAFFKEMGIFGSAPGRRMKLLSRYGAYINMSSLVLIVMLVSRLLELLMKNQKVAMAYEQLKRENLQNQFNALKSQLDPHFLFNGLNTVIELIEEDKQLAKGFVAKLSEVFRYLLNHSNVQLIRLEEEIEFSKNYIYLLKLRHSQLSVVFELEETHRLSWKIPPLAIQLLLENAIKHNEISKQRPLEISVKQTNDILVVTNRINKKIGTTIYGAGMGLKNLSERYRILTGQKIHISQEENLFKVIIPLVLV